MDQPGKTWPSLIQPSQVPFESFAHVPCLALLGEPGMGKSFALRAAAKTVEKSVEGTVTKTLLLDLRSYGSEDRLIRDLFESETFRSWSRGECQLHVFLDSLDETLLRPSTIAHVLLDKLRDCPSVALTQEAVMETLSTGLFTSRGPDRLGWSHQTYAEFLAARYLSQCGMPSAQMLNLLVHQGDSERRLVPQLHETAAWLASMDIEMFRELAKSDPEVLLRVNRISRCD